MRQGAYQILKSGSKENEEEEGEGEERGGEEEDEEVVITYLSIVRKNECVGAGVMERRKETLGFEKMITELFFSKYSTLLISTAFLRKEHQRPT